MQIICPSCQTKFVTDPKGISEQGRRVRCSQCQYVWWHYAQSYEVHNQESEAQILAQYLPIRRRYKLKYLYVLPILFLAFVGVIALHRYQNAIPIPSSTSSQSTKLEGVSTTYTSWNTIVKWYMPNTTGHDQPLPALAIELIDSRGNVLKRHEIKEQRIIKAKKNLMLKVIFFNENQRVEKVAIYVDSKLEYLAH